MLGKPNSQRSLARRIAALIALPIIVAACSRGDAGQANKSSEQNTSANTTASCADNNAGLILPAGFCATIFADTIGHSRHLVVAPNGVVYVNTWSGSYYQTPAHQGGFLVALRDTNNDGK